MQGSGASLMRGIRRTRVPEADLPLVGWGYAMTKEGCVFCEIAADLEDPLVTRLGDVLVLPALKQRERNRGHMLVIPVPHVTRLSEATGSLIEQLYMTAGRVGVAMRRAFDATGTLLFQNEDAPDQVLLHLHIHVVPRRSGDDFKLPDPTSAEVDRAERLAQASALRRCFAVGE